MIDKTMWAVVSGEYSDYPVSAVFATEELAEQAVTEANGREEKGYFSYEVQEFPYFDQPARMRVRYTRTLVSDGASREKERGVGYCECGAESPELPSTAARKRWHAEHKDRIRNPENWTYKGVKP